MDNNESNGKEKSELMQISIETRKKTVNTLIKKRKELGLSQQKVAESLGISQSTFKDIEIGKINLSLDYFLSLAKLYDLPLDFQFYEAKEKTEEEQILIYLEFLANNETQLTGLANNFERLSNAIKNIYNQKQIGEERSKRIRLQLETSQEDKEYILEKSKEMQKKPLQILLEYLKEKDV